MRTCKVCGSQFRPPHPTSRYCTTKCFATARVQANPSPSPAAARKRAQRTKPATKCETCGGTERLQRHHPDIANRPDHVEVLCQTCHTKADQALGKWGKGAALPLVCVICGTEHRKAKARTCSGACLAELGRRNALKRWRSASTDLGSWETESCPNKERRLSCG
jgi:hypothetical protein